MKPSANEFIVHRSLPRYGLAVLTASIALGAALLLEHFQFRPPASLLLLLAVAIASWYGGRGPGVVAAILSSVAYYWYFVEPVRTIYIYLSEVPRFVTFIAFAALLSWFGAVRRRAEASLRERAALLDLTHDTIFAMNMDGVIRYWNHGAQERYGWTAEQAVGSNVHELLKTVFPAPLDEIKAEVTRAGRWEGELRHARKDGTHLVVASRWSLERDDHGAPAAIMETNNDVTERKRAEEALRRLNRELRAISNCNQALLRATDEQSLLNEICRIAHEEAGYQMAWVGYAEHDEAKSVRPVAWAGVEEEYFANLGVTWADTERGHGPTGTAIRSGKTCSIHDFATDLGMVPWRGRALQEDYCSGIALPLKDENANTFGSFAVYSDQPNEFTPEEIRLLEELAGDMAYGIVNLRSQVTRKQALQEVTLLSFALNTVREAAYLIDDSGRYHYVNDEGCRALGYTRAQLLGMSVTDIDPQFPAELWSDHWRDLKEHRSLSFESSHRTRAGRIFPVEISANYFEYGGRAYNLGLVRDISERKLAEQELRRSEAWLAQTQAMTRTGSVVFDSRTGDALYLSDEWYRVFGFDPARDRSDAWERRWERIHPEDRAKWKATIQKSLEEQSEWELEARLLIPDGSIKNVHVKAHPVVGPSGDVEQFVGSITDITERKRAEEIIRRQEIELRQVLDLTPLLVAVLGPDRERVYANRPALDYFGLTLEEWMSISDPFCFYHPDDRELIARYVYRGDEVQHEFEARFRKSDGSYRWFLFRDNPVRDEEGCITRWYFSATDIEERKRAEEKLRQSEEELRQLVDVIPQQVFVFDADWSPVFANRRELEYTGLSSQEIRSKDAVAQTFHPEDLKKLEVARERALADGVSFEMEARIRGKNGQYRWLLIQDNPLRDEQGRILRWYGTRTDIEDRKRAEDARSKAQADLAHVNRVNLLGELAASISHELNQPIAATILNASLALQWLDRDPPDLAQIRHRATQIIEMGELASGIIDRLRSLYKKEPPKREPTSVNDVIGEMVVLLRGEAMRHAVSVRADLADSLPIILADRVQIQQVLMNLMLNSIEAMKDTGGILTVKSQYNENGQIEISVHDTGPGLPPGKAGQIFDAFFTTKPKGSGMGLAISKSIVESHGGRIWANGNGGRGATFHFTLPSATVEADVPANVK